VCVSVPLTVASYRFLFSQNTHIHTHFQTWDIHILNSTFFTQRAFYTTGNKSVEVQHQQQCIPPASTTQKLGQHQNGMWFIWAIAVAIVIAARSGKRE